MPGTTITDLQAGALYNYLLVARGSGWGVHNPTYTKQLLCDSILQLKGSAPDGDPDAALRDGGGLDARWP